MIFEVTVDPAQGGRKFDLTSDLHAELVEAEGFLSIERFQSLSTRNKFVSLSFWRDRDAVEAWNRRPNHKAGRRGERFGLLCTGPERPAALIA